MKTWMIVIATLLAPAACRRTDTGSDRSSDMSKPVESTDTTKSTQPPITAGTPGDNTDKSTNPTPQSDTTAPQSDQPKPADTTVLAPSDQTAPNTWESGNDQPDTQGTYTGVRRNYVTTAHDRLERIDQKLRDVESRVDTAAKDAAVRLRSRRDALAKRIDTIGVQAESGFNDFRANLSATMDELDRDLDAAVQNTVHGTAQPESTTPDTTTTQSTTP